MTCLTHTRVSADFYMSISVVVFMCLSRRSYLLQLMKISLLLFFSLLLVFLWRKSFGFMRFSNKTLRLYRITRRSSCGSEETQSRKKVRYSRPISNKQFRLFISLYQLISAEKCHNIHLARGRQKGIFSDGPIMCLFVYTLAKREESTTWKGELDENIRHECQVYWKWESALCNVSMFSWFNVFYVSMAEAFSQLQSDQISFIILRCLVWGKELSSLPSNSSSNIRRHRTNPSILHNFLI